jgi:hypothetical protein
MDDEGASGLGDWDARMAQPAMGHGVVRGRAQHGGGRGVDGCGHAAASAR